MKIAIVVQGRFHSFDLARALTKRGHEVHVFTNYPVWAAARFGLQPEMVHSLWAHGIASRIAGRPASAGLHIWFSKWAACQLRKNSWDVIYCFSGIARDVLFSKLDSPRRFVVRGSSHIRVQDCILREESQRTGVRLERPTQWMMDREEREYALADRVVVLSRFAMESFVRQGVGREKLSLLRLGVDTEAFRPSAAVLNARVERILSGAPLRVTFTGTLNYRKGLYDFERIVRALDPARFRFEVIGSVARESARIAAAANVTVIPRQPQSRLPEYYARGDVFLFPTIEDGFAVVLAQAHANALPILTTMNCAGPDIIEDGESGWVLPIRRPDLFIERLLWCDAHRDKVAEMVLRLNDNYMARDWDDVATDFECLGWEGSRRGASLGFV